MRRIYLLLLFFALISFISNAQTIQYFQTGEEFSGPFPSWKNVKTDFGAMGDGVTNDAPAINAALLAMKNTQTNPYNVLYFPAGTYLITDTLYNVGRVLGDDYSGMAIIGEDPATTIIKWGGLAFGTMMYLNGWYMRVSRLTFDGSDSAMTGIFHTGGFSTGCEWSDLVFQNFNPAFSMGLNFSAPTNGQAENAVIRCTFKNVKYGITTNNWNSLDQWIWNCSFQNCYVGVDLNVGYCQVYGNVFLNSKWFDIGGGNTYQSVAINNTSFNSASFWNKGPGYLRGNKIYSNVDSFYMVGAVGFDNIIRAGNTTYPIQRIAGINITGNHNLLVGNTYSTSHRLYPFGWPVQPPFSNFNHAVGAGYLIGHPIEKAIDNDSTTWFTCGESQPSSGLRWNCLPSNPRVVTKYTVRQGTQAGDTASNPLKWQFRGSNDWGNSWTILDTQSNQHWTWRQKKTFNILNTNAYSLYEFNILLNADSLAPGQGGWYSFSDIQMFDASGYDITQDTTGLLTGADEYWGGYYPIDNQILDTNSIVVPTSASLPGTPINHHRTIFEVQQGTGNDAAAIQQKIDSVAMQPLGNKSVVHIRNGAYSINTTIIVPANKDMQIIGDGVGSGTITRLNWNGNNTGPLINFQGPSRVTVKDVQFNISNHQNQSMDVIRVENADQVGGRIYANQFFAGSLDAAHSADKAIYCDGVEDSDVTIECTSYGAALNGVVNARGGPVLSSGGSTNGQISCLSGATGGTQNIFTVSDGGRIDAEGMWYEGYNVNNNSGLINLSNTSGSISIACMQWYLNNTALPIIATDNFSGNLTLLDNSFNQVPRAMIQMQGDGTNANFFSAFNDIGGADSIGVTTDSVWLDLTNPNANASLMDCMGGTGNYYRWFNNVVNTVHNVIPDTTTILRSIAQLRAVRTDPANDMAAGVTDVKFFRVASRCVEGNIAAHFISNQTVGVPQVSCKNSSNNISIYPDPNNGNFTIKNLKSIVQMNSADIKVYDVYGKEVYHQTINNSTPSNINIPNLSSGIYYWELVSNKGMEGKGKFAVMGDK